MEDSAIDMLTSGKVQAAALPLYELIPYMVGGLKLRIFHHPTLENSGQCRLSRLTRDPDQQA